MKAIPLRLKPRQDLRLGIENFCVENDIHSACILTCVGSLTTAALRMAGASEIIQRDGPFEIISLVGTISKDGVHFHSALSDANGVVWGGHVAKGCIVYTTAEIILGVLEDYTFTREHDAQTQYPELKITKN